MSTSSPDPPSGEPRRDRLPWPGSAPGADPDARRDRDAARVDPSRHRSAVHETGVDAGPDAGVDDGFDRPLRALPVLDSDAAGASALRRAVVQRLRSMHEDVDADLAELRAELTALRHSVEDLAERVQLRQVRSSVDDLRSDLAGLRRAVLEWPELERVSADVTAIRADLSDLMDRRPVPAPPPPPPPVTGEPPDAVLPPGALAPVLEELANVRADLESLAGATDPHPATGGDPEGLIEELGALRSDITALRRRITLRAGSDAASGDGLTPDQLERLADLVVERLMAAMDPSAPR